MAVLRGGDTERGAFGDGPGQQVDQSFVETRVRDAAGGEEQFHPLDSTRAMRDPEASRLLPTSVPPSPPP